MEGHIIVLVNTSTMKVVIPFNSIPCIVLFQIAFPLPVLLQKMVMYTSSVLVSVSHFLFIVYSTFPSLCSQVCLEFVQNISSLRIELQ